jgi:hypothetical protein
LASINQPQTRIIAPPREPISVVQYLRSEGHAITEGATGVFGEIDKKVPEELRYFLTRRDGAATICECLPTGVVPGQIADDKVQEVWHLCGLYYFNLHRFHEALAVFVAFYEQMLRHQEESGNRIHKGTPLVRISECHQRLGHIALSKRYLMLTACEDAIIHRGRIDAETTGVYFRMIWGGGMGHWAFQQYAMLIWEIFQKHSMEARSPEWILQELDHDWMTEYPSAQEAVVYTVTQPYVRWLLAQLGSGTGQGLERLAHYLLSCMPGCRAHMRKRSPSTDYDVVCTADGAGLDFRSELGRYFICECKDWNNKADFTTMAKFCRVLDSAKCSFGILFSKNGISGKGEGTNAEREQIKVFQQRGMVVIVVSEADLKQVAEGANFLTMLRSKYEQVRLDLRA